MSLENAIDDLRRLQENDRREYEQAERMMKREQLHEALLFLEVSASPAQRHAMSIVTDAIQNPKDYEP